MINLYQNEWRLFKESYWKSFVVYFILFVGSGILSYFLFLGRERELTYFMEEIMNMFDDKGLFKPGITSFTLALLLLKNNATASFIIYVTGLFPIFIPAVLIIVANGALIGIVFSALKRSGEGILLPLLTAIVPHGIFEIPAVVLSASLSFYVSVGIIKKLMDSEFSLRTCLINSLKTFLLVVLPLLVIAAVVEAFITPAIIGMTVVY